ncbi:F0F1 ATP synthase subunit A [Lutibacter sp. TH_r2]|uniref:F0F1 ATP synthase subunit A n=1 Tax=Lutibacter sp. TH_r2 TaxID=3082083 RepID=UPI00295302FF|nr:F0F1 ATP synthase subunit A [Lutibacter sp. TH_r2]MDV7186701.1 F0F1 ATP synthase subunit A [Lutibacter sp. TH_r2]
MIAPKSIKNFFISVFMLLSCVQVIQSQENHNDKSHDSHQESHQKNNHDEPFDASEMINHHIGDAHSFHIVDINKHSYSLPLPVILYTDNGLVTFMSSEFHHDNDGKVIVEKNGQKFVSVHENIYQLNEGEQTLAFDAEHHPTNAKKPLDFSITKNVFSMLMSAIILFLLFSAVARSYKKNPKAPKGLAGFLEPLVLFVRDDIAIPNIGEHKYAKFMPYLLTVFFFIWINNLIGLVPIFPGSSNLTGNIVFTGVLAFITFLITTLSGNKNYWSHILTPPVPKALYPIMIPIEIIGMFTKPFALMIRLFANITAGHIIILSLVSLIFIFKTVAIAPVSAAFVLFMSVLELLVAALQAYVFTLLSALFIGQAVADDHH